MRTTELETDTSLGCLYIETPKIIYQQQTFGKVPIWQNALAYIKRGIKQQKVKHMHVEGLGLIFFRIKYISMFRSDKKWSI